MTTQAHSIVIVDQDSIIASFGGESLFVDGVHVMDMDQDNYIEGGLTDVAESLSVALKAPVQRIILDTYDLAYSIAQDNANDEEFATFSQTESYFEDWVEGYTNHDVWTAIKTKVRR